MICWGFNMLKKIILLLIISFSFNIFSCDIENKENYEKHLRLIRKKLQEKNKPSIRREPLAVIPTNIVKTPEGVLEQQVLRPNKLKEAQIRKLLSKKFAPRMATAGLASKKPSGENPSVYLQRLNEPNWCENIEGSLATIEEIAGY